MRPDSPLAHAKHILRAALLLVLATVAVVLGRFLFVPASWGQWGSYRADNVEEQRAVPARHGGNAACAACHDAEHAELVGGRHATLACESCHAPLAQHVAGDELVAEMPVRRDVGLCLDCHARLDARPVDHPQIQERQHLAEQGVEPTPDVCFDCHSPHSPL
jgi:hypothetical protein